MHALLLLMMGPLALATSTAPQGVTNEQAVKTWKQASPGAPTPQLTEITDGGTKIEWTGGVTADFYVNNVSSANGSVTTPLYDGNFQKSVIQSDLKVTDSSGTMSYFQFGVTETNDRSVLAQKWYQLNNFQIGRSGQTYGFSLGDVSPNYSPLSSVLGTRGAMGQKQFGNATVYAFAGTVAEKWEALTKAVPRNQFLRDTFGSKIEYAITPELKVYGTGQSASDRAGTITNPLIAPAAQALTLAAATAGLSYAKDKFHATVEEATSNHDVSAQQITGKAFVADSGWSDASLTLRGGFHDIDAGFLSLAGTATPGVREGYAGGDWAAAKWATLGLDLRDSQLSTLLAPDPLSTTKSGALRASTNFGDALPGLGMTLQETNTFASGNNSARSNDANGTLTYTSPTWTSNVGYSFNTITNLNQPTTDSHTTNWQASVGRTFSNNEENSSLQRIWSLTTVLSGNAQIQRLLAGGETDTYSGAFTITGQRDGWGSMNLAATEGLTTQPNGASNLRLLGFQFDASHQFGPSASAKIYFRDTHKNINDPLLNMQERVTGLQLAYKF
jgi:hypothetical protein